MADVFDEIVELCRQCSGSLDRIYVDSENYHELLKKPGFRREYGKGAAPHRTIIGMEVIVIDDLEQEIMLLESSGFPIAEDFQKGYIQPKPL